MSVGAHIRIDGLIRQARGAGLSKIETLLRTVRLDWDQAWDNYRAANYRIDLVPFPDVGRLLNAVDQFDAAGFPVHAATARAIVAQIEQEKDRAASTRSNTARQAAKPGGAGGRINRAPGFSFAEKSMPGEDSA
ncbi:MAG: hypothetical protein NBV67_00310 [Tagaea sp.]|nr:hypothetical protein [Tagaea sp.]